MNEPNYESIGRCTVLMRRINHKLEALRDIRQLILSSESSRMACGSLQINYSEAECIEEAAVKCRGLLRDIAAMALEHNEYAPSAGLGVIDIRVSGELPTKPNFDGAEDFLSSSRLKRLVSYAQKLKQDADDQWLARFMEDEIAYLIERAEAYKDNFSAIEHDIARSSAWLWFIIRSHQKIPYAPHSLDSAKTIREWESRYAATHA